MCCFFQLYFKDNWLNLHLKLIDACLDINDPPKPSLGTSGKEKIDGLWPFLLFFSLCLSQDKNFNIRLLLILKHPDLFYKIAIIADCVCYFCCCGQGYRYNDDRNNTGILSLKNLNLSLVTNDELEILTPFLIELQKKRKNMNFKEFCILIDRDLTSKYFFK